MSICFMNVDIPTDLAGVRPVITIAKTLFDENSQNKVYYDSVPHQE